MTRKDHKTGHHGPQRGTRRSTPLRSPLSREQIRDAAVQMADDQGVSGLSMRKLAEVLNVEAMSLYHHVKNKQELLNMMVEHVYSDVYMPEACSTWREELRRRSQSMHAALLAHPWAAALMESSSTGPRQQALSEATVGCLLHAGFSPRLTHYALMSLDSHLYGFAFQETTWPVPRHQLPELIRQLTPEFESAGLRHTLVLMRIIEELCQKPPNVQSTPKAVFAEAFEFGLELILDGLEMARNREELSKRSP